MFVPLFDDPSGQVVAQVRLSRWQITQLAQNWRSYDHRVARVNLLHRPSCISAV